MTDDYLMHYGKGHLDGGHSGRYPWGSGEDPCQRERDLISKYNNLKAKGYSNTKIAEQLEIYNQYGKPSAGRLKAKLSVAKDNIKVQDISIAKKLADEGYSTSEIGRKLGKNESTVRGWLDEDFQQRRSGTRKTADMLEQLVDKKQFIDVSTGSNIYLGVTESRMKDAIALAVEDGYIQSTIKVPQVGTNHATTVTVLSPPGTTYGELIENRFDIKPVFDENRVVDIDGVVTSLGMKREQIHSISPDRVKIVYRDEVGLDKEGVGEDKDGLIELRRGVDDISIGANNYAQVRIPVNDTHYIKGMAVYRDDLPPGIDIVFNTNKKSSLPMMDGSDGVLKPMKENKETGEIDWDNPFGASIKQEASTQLTYFDKDGKRQYSACNIVNEEGDWSKWDRNVSSQLGSKQPVKLTERQLNISYLDKKNEFETINSLTNPSVKKALLLEFADKCDEAAVELKGAPFPGQATHVIIPCPKLKDNEIYAPNYKDGTVVALVRHPYAGPFESPRLVVRNNGSPAKSIIGPNAPDAVAINHKVASQLSGADFDGDTVAVIPLTDKVRLTTKPPLAGLKDFDPSDAYPGYKGMVPISPQNKQNQMGRVTNLITDMTLKGADEQDIVKAVKHSMVIIDSEKHNLDWKRSERENDILELKRKYQDDGSGHTGAGTIVSRASAEQHIPILKDWKATKTSIDSEGGKILTQTNETITKVKLKGEKVRDESTGKLKTVYSEDAGQGGWINVFTDKAGNYYYSKRNKTTGKKERVYLSEDDYTNVKTELRTMEVKRMSTVKDAYSLTSGGSKDNPGYPHEKIYAEYANNCKALANLARHIWVETKEDKKDPQAAKTYSAQVESLERKLKIAEANAPKERQAQMMANRTMEKKRTDNPEMSKEQEKKYKTQAINAARDILGVKRKNVLIDITDEEWEAIQHKAISSNKLNRIFKNTDSDAIKKRATPRDTKTVSSSMEALAKSMAKAGYTNEQIADRLGISPTSVYRVITGKK